MTKRVSVGGGHESTSFELLWNQRRMHTRGPEPAFRLGDIAQAGAEIADIDGLSALTMAAVARSLGVTTMAVYRYVPSKGALIDLVADSVMSRPPKPSKSSWRADISSWTRANLALVRRHPWLFEIISTRACPGPNWACWLDAGLECLDGLPFSVSEKLAVLLLVDGHFRAAAQVLVGAKASEEWAQNFGGMLRAAAGNSRYPTLSALLAAGEFEQPGLGLEAMIEFGLERLLDGIEAMARTRSDLARGGGRSSRPKA
jgi:AcrR family transcriptional regulator